MKNNSTPGVPHYIWSEQTLRTTGTKLIGSTDAQVIWESLRDNNEQGF
jgi:hypothetical protein